jgi:K+-sensing histidine kinase KdpD
MNRSSSFFGGLDPDEPLAIAVGSFSFLALGFLLDIATTQELVVAILYNAPIAFSGLSTTRRLTFYAVLAALVANLIAGYLNASALGGVDTIALLNRFIAALSFLLVGFMTGALRRTSARLAALKLSEKQATREHKLHRLTSALEGALRPTELLDASCHALRDLLEAEAVIISNFAHNHFTPPQHSDPVGAPLSFARVGQGVPWLVAAAMTNDPPVVAGIVDGRPLMVGRLNPSEGPDLVVLIVQARAEDATPFLARRFGA